MFKIKILDVFGMITCYRDDSENAYIDNAGIVDFNFMSYDIDLNTGNLSNGVSICSKTNVSFDQGGVTYFDNFETLNPIVDENKVIICLVGNRGLAGDDNDIKTPYSSESLQLKYTIIK